VGGSDVVGNTTIEWGHMNEIPVEEDKDMLNIYEFSSFILSLYILSLLFIRFDSVM